jgi:2-methylfumaryl-CoA isomerase
MFDHLGGLRIVEGASFIAGPSCALHLLQMGADVIRFDMIGGGPDFRRWPLAGDGISLYWQGLNKGKRSIAIDLSKPEGRELAAALITAPGPGRGLFVTNYPVEGFLSHEALAKRRSDLITLRVMGWPDGRNAVDYTVNAAVGVPLMTGPASLPADEPVNSVLPAWDLLAGAYGAFSLLAAERRRRETGQGGEIRIALSDVAIGALGMLGQVAEVLQAGDRPRGGNALFGAFGRDFRAGGGERVMIVAITARQWSGLIKALAIGPVVERLERELGVSFARDEGKRYDHRDRLFPIVEAAVGARTLSELAPAFDREGVCWEPYRSLHDAVRSDARVVAEDALFAKVQHPGGITYPTPGALARLPGEARLPPGRAPRLGEHTDQILAEVLDLPEREIGRLHDAGVVAGPGEGRS